LIHIQQQLEEVNAINLHWQERYQHLQELLAINQQELARERETLRRTAQREQTHYQLFIQIQMQMKKGFSQFRSELQTIKQIALSFHLFAASEIIQTVNQFRFEFQRIFSALLEKQEYTIRNHQIGLQSAHSKELTGLEEKFVSQIRSIQQQHSQELEKLHRELLTRTERALNASVLSVSEKMIGSVSFDTFHQQINKENQHQLGAVSTIRILTDTSDVQQSLSTSSSSTLSTRKTNSSSASLIPAYASVLKGILQGLLEQEVVRHEAQSQFFALSDGHQEPSFAALSAARALICEELDIYVEKLLKKKYLLTSN
jgi:hypothetical protein